VPQEKLRPLREALSSAEWQEIKSSYGKPGGFYMVIEGSGKHTPIGVSSEVGSNFPVVSVPQILEEVADAFGGSLADGDVV
jgi:hypothetical protein